MLRSLAIAIALFLAVGLRAQQATYFPHHLGDMWEYFVLDGVGNDTLQVRVIFDSTDPGGSSYMRHHRRLVNLVRPPWFSWYDAFKIDTIGDILGSGLSPRFCWSLSNWQRVANYQHQKQSDGVVVPACLAG